MVTLTKTLLRQSLLTVKLGWARDCWRPSGKCLLLLRGTYINDGSHPNALKTCSRVPTEQVNSERRRSCDSSNFSIFKFITAFLLFFSQIEDVPLYGLRKRKIFHLSPSPSSESKTGGAKR